MTLGELLRGIDGAVAHGATAIDVSAIADDSRAVTPGALFVALPGGVVDGRRFATEALARGAVAIAGPGPVPEGHPAHVPYVELDAPRRALAELARRLENAPDERLDVVGVTGTNGKTTTIHLLGAAFDAAGRPAALGGTIGQRAGTFAAPARLTTPEAPALWHFLGRAAAEGCRAAAIEVSSAALAAERVHGLRFAAAVLTGIGHDHLDTHGTFEAYVDAKRQLFAQLEEGRPAVLPGDDPLAPSFRAATRGRVVTFGETEACDWRVTGHRPLPDGAVFRLRGPGFEDEVRTARPGPWDARNLAAAVACAVALGVPAPVAVAGAASVPHVDGRWQPVPTELPLTALVDYAHTPDALDRTLRLLRRVTAGRVIVVFGCGGDRDRTKRPAMGRIAGTLADVVIVTEDNPRSEDPERIAREVLEGLQGTPAEAHRVAGREKAIRRAVELAAPGDAVLVTGKGHETYQEIAGRRQHFDDREQLGAALAAKAGA